LSFYVAHYGVSKHTVPSFSIWIDCYILHEVLPYNNLQKFESLQFLTYQDFYSIWIRLHKVKKVAHRIGIQNSDMCDGLYVFLLSGPFV
jgi:hypothetical protein